MPDYFEGFCSLWPGANPEGYDEEYANYASSHQPFSKMFLMHTNNFSIISNLFNSYKPYALSTHNQQRANKMYHTVFGEALRIRVKKFEHNLPENYSKSTKIAITVAYANFQKFSGGACSRTPLKLFLFSSLCKFSKIFRGSMLPDPPKAFLVSSSVSNYFKLPKKRR